MESSGESLPAEEAERGMLKAKARGTEKPGWWAVARAVQGFRLSPEGIQICVSCLATHPPFVLLAAT